MAVTVNVSELSEQLGFEVLEEGKGSICFQTNEINRPGLQFTGFYKKFAAQRVQLIGNAEMVYLYSLAEAELSERMEYFMRFDVPCILCARDNQPPEILLCKAKEHGIPVFKTSMFTDQAGHAIAGFIQAKLAPKILIHGELIDVFGVGVLLRGESGTGKSEAALELIRGGHRLVADDVVEVSRIGEKLIGRAPEATKHMMEVRGIGFIDIRYLYGVGAILPEKEIQFVIDLEYMEDYLQSSYSDDGHRYAEILGTSLPNTVLPISPGRNLAVVVEVAARNFRLKHLGYDSNKEFLNRIK